VDASHIPPASPAPSSSARDEAFASSPSPSSAAVEESPASAPTAAAENFSSPPLLAPSALAPAEDAASPAPSAPAADPSSRQASAAEPLSSDLSPSSAPEPSPLDLSAASLAAAVGFVHLHVHSAYSLREGALAIETLAKRAKADDMPALAITDANNLFGALEFSEKLATEGVQPIIGAQITVDFGDAAARGADRASAAPIVLLAQNEAGYRNLMRIASDVWLGHEAGEAPHVAFEALAPVDGLIALTGGPSGPIDAGLTLGRNDLAEARLERLATLFPDRLYVEIQRHFLAAERANEHRLLDLADRLGLPLVATNEPYFAALSDHEAQDALLCIADGALIGDADRRRLSPEHRFKTRAEMVQLFADLPEALANTIEIAQRCAFRPETRKPILPRFTAPDGAALDEVKELRAQAEAGLAKRLSAHGCAEGASEEDYRRRLAFELDVIEKMKFPGYFLIVADFIQWAKRQGIPVGPGRGSGAGSLVAYALTITDLDPIRFGLLFERFLNPERVSMPDFDIDFCQDRRDEVIAYVRRRYGADRVAQIITFGSFLARGVMRNVGRVLEMPLGQVDRLAKLVPQNPAKPITLKQAVIDEARLGEAAAADPRVAQMLAIAEKLEGLYSNASTHAAGVVIADRPLVELVPLYRDPKSEMPATQFNMKWVEPAGLVKFDFLGLKTLTVLQKTVEMLSRRGVAVDLSMIPLDDKKTYEMLGRGETVGVFQVESGGMRKALVEMRADRFEDLIALVALYRPGPMANIPAYCARKLGQEKVEYLHPELEPILKETFGVITYQEQVQQIARDLAGYSLAQADILRRAMGKKIKKEMDAQRGRFVSGAVEHGLAKALADEIFDACAKFAEYGFNKSHSAPYALLTYQTAYLKANYPVEFLAASMTLDKSNTDKLAEFRAEALRLGLKVEPPSVNASGVDFEALSGADGALSIRYALSAIKGVGGAQAEALVAARGEKPFSSLADFARRIDPRLVNKKALESLAAAGAFDEIEPERARAFASVEPALATAHRALDEKAMGQDGLFAEAEAAPLVTGVKPWSATDRLRREFESVGFFLSGHPLEAYGAALKRLRVERWVDFVRNVRGGATSARLAASVLDRYERRTKSGSKMGVVQLSDPTGQYEAVIFQEGLNQFRDLLEKGADVLVTLQGAVEGEDVRARIVSVEPLAEAASRHQKGLRIFLRDQAPLSSIAERLRARGEGEVTVVAMLGKAEGEVEIRLPGRFAVSAAIAGSLKSVEGVVAVEHL
jgi:DNA polymerase III subunit alpha